MTYPNREHTLAMLNDWAMHHTSVQAMMDSIEASIGLDINGPMFDTVWSLFDAYTDALAVELGDHTGWMKWYCDENDMGAKGRAAGYDDKIKPVKTLMHLYVLIAESRKRE